MSDIKIGICGAGARIYVVTPYLPAFVARARELGGTWKTVSRQNGTTEKAWVFDARDAGRVRDLCRDLYGTDGADNPTLVDVRITSDADQERYGGGIFFGGREVAFASGRHTGARLGKGTVLVGGPKPRSGGSVRNWLTVVPAGCVLEVRDLPLPIVEDEIEAGVWAIEIVRRVDPAPPAEPAAQDPRAALIEERAALVARVAEIDALLADVPAPAIAVRGPREL